MKVNRFDSGSMKPPTKMKNGWLRADAWLTRVGVFTYQKADGTTVREYRPREEVFRSDSLESLRQVPLTLGHPTEGDGLLTAENAKEHTVGNVGHGYPDYDDFYVQGPILITDKAAVLAVEAGQTALSCGYTADMDTTPGEYMGQAYDEVQRNIVYNHVAIVDSARAGVAVKIKLDDAYQIETPTPKESTMKVVIGGITYDNVPESAGQAMDKELANMQVKLDSANALIKKAETDAATAQAKLDSAEAKLKDISDPKKLLEKVNLRAALLSQAREVVTDPAVKLDEMDDQAVKLQVLKKLRPDVKLDEKTPEYIGVYYEATMASAATTTTTPKVTTALSQARADANSPPTTTAPSTEPNPEAARQKMIEDNANAWKPKPN